MTDHLTYKRLGSTRDDAAGEAFDKVARLLGLAYPGGPSIQRAAETGDPNRFKFPRAKLDNPYDFSFSGLKTAVLYEVNKLKKTETKLPVEDLAASFQAAVVDVLFNKTMQTARDFNAKEILVAGGVSANRALRQAFQSQNEFKVHIPPFSLCTDNAAMIAAAGYYRYVLGHVSELGMDVQPTWPLS
jgi:N6-L-threonylcarbamoyladenine synthase